MNAKEQKALELNTQLAQANRTYNTAKYNCENAEDEGEKAFYTSQLAKAETKLEGLKAELASLNCEAPSTHTENALYSTGNNYSSRFNNK